MVVSLTEVLLVEDDLVLLLVVQALHKALRKAHLQPLVVAMILLWLWLSSFYSSSSPCGLSHFPHGFELVVDVLVEENASRHLQIWLGLSMLIPYALTEAKDEA